MTTQSLTRPPLVTLSGALPWVIATFFLLAMPQIFTSNSALTIMNQMAITIVFGLAMTTLLVLFLVPALVGIGDDVARAFSYIYGRRPLVQRA